LFGGGGGMFGGGRSRPSGPRRGKDMSHPLKVSLEDLYKVNTLKILMKTGKNIQIGIAKTNSL
jgi:DnaJ-class molecular chaperone